MSLLCVSKSESGKTNLLINMILKYRKYFKDNLYIFNKSPDLTIKKRLIDNPKINGVRFTGLFDKYGNSVIKEIMNNQQEMINNGENPPHVLIYLDDFYCGEMMKKNDDLFLNLYSLARHLNISIIQIIHQWTSISPTIRRLCKFFIFFKISNRREKEFCAYELCKTINKTEKKFIFLFDEITKEQYNFMLIDATTGKFYHNFDYPDKELKLLEEAKEKGI